MSEKKLKKSDFESDQDVRWCPGCGDYSILATVQRFLPALGKEPHEFAFISGIGCSSRFPYYMNTYGFHTIHGRAPSFATGVKTSKPELSVWMITGDGDALSIGGNHVLHVLRRNVDINILLFNNQIYGLTKGQYSPTSEVGKLTKSSPQGSVDQPLNPLAVALGSNASFVARSLDVDAKHLTSMLQASEDHRGTSFLEIYQNCNIFNDGAFDNVRERDARAERQLILEDGKPMIFGKEKNKGIKISNFKAEVVEFNPEEDGAPEKAGVCLHDSSNRVLAHILAELPRTDEFPVPMGVIYQEQRPVFDEDMCKAVTKNDLDDNQINEKLNSLFNSGNTWAVS